MDGAVTLVHLNVGAGGISAMVTASNGTAIQQHTYAAPGTYRVVLTVVDDGGPDGLPSRSTIVSLSLDRFACGAILEVPARRAPRGRLLLARPSWSTTEPRGVAAAGVIRR